jgi:hypothetical protein
VTQRPPSCLYTAAADRWVVSRPWWAATASCSRVGCCWVGLNCNRVLSCCPIFVSCLCWHCVSRSRPIHDHASCRAGTETTSIVSCRVFSVVRHAACRVWPIWPSIIEIPYKPKIWSRRQTTEVHQAQMHS